MVNNQNLLTPLIYTIKELTKIISEEIALLKTRRPKEVEKLLPLKNKLIAAYQQEMSDLKARGGLQVSGSGSAIRTLKQESRVFQSVLTQHKRLIKALKHISENMIKTISDEVVRSQNPTTRYDAHGSRQIKRAPISISLNQTI